MIRTQVLIYENVLKKELVSHKLNDFVNSLGVTNWISIKSP